MWTQRDSLPWWRLSLLLLLVLVVPPATAQVLSYNEAVLRAVEVFNQRSSEASLYRLLGLDQQPPDEVSWGGCLGGRLWASQVGHTASAFALAVPGVRESLLPFSGTPPPPGELPELCPLSDDSFFP